MKNNLAAILVRQKKKLSILNLNFPELKKGHLLIKIKYSGICHTQLNEISGILGKDKYLPHCIGHEGVGVVMGIGSSNSKFNKGDNVVVSWIRKKNFLKTEPIFFYDNNKKINSGGCNTLQQYTVVTEDRAFKLSKKNKFLRESVLLGCALPTAANAILNVAKINKKSRVLIMGMGGLGYSSLIVLNFLKIKNVVCIDSNKKRLSFFKNTNNLKFECLNKDNINKFVRKNFESFDLIIDCTGSKNLIEKTYSLCKKFSGKFIIIGNTKINEKISLKTWDVIFGKTLTGAWGSNGVVMNNFRTNEKILISQIKNIRKILPKKNFEIKNINKAIEDFSGGKILRPIIKF
tara:strand:+ start:1589 stop:2629 length:1041 start_codon:yes stop_codon:yes gene_type:complete